LHATWNFPTINWKDVCFGIDGVTVKFWKSADGVVAILLFKVVAVIPVAIVISLIGVIAVRAVVVTVFALSGTTGVVPGGVRSVAVAGNAILIIVMAKVIRWVRSSATATATVWVLTWALARIILVRAVVVVVGNSIVIPVDISLRI